MIPKYGESNQIQVAIFSERRFNEVQNLRFNFLKYNGEKEEERKAEEERQRLIALYNANYNNAWAIARSLVGRGGDCWSICKLFIQLFSGKNINNRYVVSEPVPGDIIYYSNGGLGVNHWAVYLGDGLALHSNYNGIAQIKSIYLTGASYPVYYRVK